MTCSSTVVAHPPSDVFAERAPNPLTEMDRPAYVAPQRGNAAWMAELKEGKRMALGCAINSTSTLCAEIVSATGYDFVLIDQQHSAA